MSLQQRKPELYRLIGELHGSHRWTAHAISIELHITVRRVQQIIADIAMPPTQRSELPALLLEAIDDFVKRNECSARFTDSK